MGRPVADKLGQRYGRLVVTSQLPRVMRDPVMWECLCDCGGTATVAARFLRPGGQVNSCGCLRSIARRRRPLTSPLARFFEKVKVTPTCWLWTGAKDPDTGYGRFGLGGKGAGTCLASRYILEMILQRPIRPGLLACHHCDNPSCVRPSHLYEGTYSENLRDAWKRTRKRAAG